MKNTQSCVIFLCALYPIATAQPLPLEVEREKSNGPQAILEESKPVRDIPDHGTNEAGDKIRRHSSPVSSGSVTVWFQLQPWFKALEKSMPSGVSLSIEQYDSDDFQWSKIQVREIHAPESGYDPNVSPTVGFFRVSSDRKTTHWLNVVTGDWESTRAFLRSRKIGDDQPGEAAPVRGAAVTVRDPGKAYTPAKGDPERTALCDAMRAHIIKGNRGRKLPEFLFKIEFIRVSGDFAGFAGFPVKPDGSPQPDGVFEDIVHTTLLQKTSTGWKVVVDLSRTDVPTAQEVSKIKKTIPAGFPKDVVPEFWRDLLKL